MNESTVAIVGGGSIATSVLHQLFQELKRADTPRPAEVLVFETRARVGAGAAYQQDTESSVLNTRVVGMSVDADDPRHFWDWAQRSESRWRAAFPNTELREQAFLPRAIFGLYLEDCFSAAQMGLRSLGVRVRHVRAEVGRLEPQGAGYRLHTVQGRSYLAQHVVLALGNAPGQRYAHLKGSPAFHAEPYPCSVLTQAVAPESTVCIIGTGLSAIDAAVALADAGHQGRIYMVSRHGRLPSVRGELSTARELKVLSRQQVEQLIAAQDGRLRLSQLAELLQQEITQQQGRAPDLHEILRPGLGMGPYLDGEVRAASSEDRIWQTVIYGLNASIDLIWHALDDRDRRLFERELKSTWLSYRVSFPIGNARKLQALMHTEQLQVFGGVQSLHFDEAQGRYVCALAQSCGRPSAALYADAVIDATGYTVDPYEWQTPLLRDLLASGLVQAHEFGGIAADFSNCQVLGPESRPRDGLYVLGSLATGTFYWTNAMNVNCRLAQNAVRHLCSRLAVDSVPAEAAREATLPRGAAARVASAAATAISAWGLRHGTHRLPPALLRALDASALEAI